MGPFGQHLISLLVGRKLELVAVWELPDAFSQCSQSWANLIEVSLPQFSE